MAVTNWQDPQTSEILSSHISGLQEAIGKIEDAIGLKTTAEVGITLSEVPVDGDRYRIYQAPIGHRNWVNNPAPVIKKNGSVINTNFTIDYGGGTLIFTPNLLSTDVVTADITRTNNSSSLNSNPYSNYVTVGAVNNTYTLNLSQGLDFVIETLDTNGKNLGFSNIPQTGNTVLCVTVLLKYTNAAPMTYAPSIVWKDGLLPIYVAGETHELLFVSYNAGVSWLGSSVGAWVL